MLCEGCIDSCVAISRGMKCGRCESEPVVRATIDGSGVCRQCPWGADSAQAWLARSKRMVDHASRCWGLVHNEQDRKALTLTLAKRWEGRESFVGNCIRWKEVKDATAELARRTPGRA